MYGMENKKQKRYELLQDVKKDAAGIYTDTSVQDGQTYYYMIRAYNFDLKKADTGVSLKKSKIPVMFVHGKEDSYVPVENVYKLASKLGENKKDVYIVENAGHAMCYPVNPRRYEFRVREFLKKWGV